MTRLLGTAVASLFLFTPDATAQGQSLDPASMRGDSPQTRKRLTEAEQKLMAGKTADAVDDLQRILDESAGDLISIDGKLFRPARWFIQQILTTLPPDALKTYQDRVDAPARKLLDAGLRSGDPAPLWSLLDRYFVSRPAAEGALLLGDILFERGEFRTAERVWKRLLPKAEETKEGDLTYPGAVANEPAVAARVVLAVIFQNDLDRAKSALADFRARFGNAQGSIAGKTGPLADILADVFRTAPRLRLSQNEGTGWTTFGGDCGRSSGLGVRPPAEWGRHPARLIPLPDHPSLNYRSPFGNPVVANGHAYVTNGTLLCDFDLRQGKLFRMTTLPGQGGRAVDRIYQPGEKAPPVPCPSLTLVGDRLYLRTGPATAAAASGHVADESFLVCYSLKPETPEGFTRLWQLPPPAGDSKSPALWEGAPLVSGRRMWAAYARHEGGRLIHGIACYDPADADERMGPPAWAVDICDSPLSTANDSRTHHELLSLAGRNVVFCSHTGAIVALEAATGHRAWAVRYPRSGRIDPNHFPDPAPAVAYGGRVFAAPADSTHVLALDPETGDLLWDHETAHGARIVGASSDQVFLEVVGQAPYSRYLQGLPAPTGSVPAGWQPRFPWACNGLGVIADEVAFLPAGEGIQCFSTRDGHVRFTLAIPGGAAGNVVYADGMLLMVTGTSLLVYRSEAATLLGMPAYRTIQDQERLRFLRIVTRAGQSLLDGDTSSGRARLVAAAHSDLPSPYRTWIAARLLLLSPPASDETGLPADLRKLLSPELRGEWVLTPKGLPVTLDSMIHSRLGRGPIAREPPARLDPPALSRLEFGTSLEIERTLRLPPGSIPLQPILSIISPSHLYVSCDKELLSLAISGNEEKRYTLSDRFTHVAEISNRVIVAGPSAVAVYANGRSPIWTFRVPITERLPSRVGEYRPYVDTPTPSAELSDFQICDDWLMARLGPHRLIAFDLQQLQVAWVKAADGTGGLRESDPPSAPRFGPSYSLGIPFTVVQVSDGRRWTIETATGRQAEAPAFTERTAYDWWRRPPDRFEDDMVVADGPGLIRRVNLHNRQVKWSVSEPKRTSSLSGEPAEARAWEDVMIMAVRRNHGVEVLRLNVDSGHRMWREGPVLLEGGDVRLADADCDSERLYIRVGNTLRAIELVTGKLAWEASLPDGCGVEGCVVRAGRNGVIVYPRAALPREALEAVAKRLRHSLLREPSAQRLPTLALGLYDAWVARTLPVLMFDPELGQELSRVDIPARGPAVGVCFNRDRMVVATGSIVAWIK